jgi:CheY-like chemotaxis protein
MTTRGRSRGRILVIEDDPELRAGLEGLLNDEGYHVATAKNGLEALLAIETESQRPSAIVLDLMMPQMNGLQFLDEMRSHNRGIPVIVLSAYVKPGQSENLRPPVRLVMTKPIDLPRLSRELAAICGTT